jgi:hypothetical protein
MIANEREYRITKSEAQQFERALAALEMQPSTRTPEQQRLLRESLAGQLQVLRKQLADYDALRGGAVACMSVDSLKDLPDALIAARVAAGLSQKGLADRLGLQAQQIQRYEAARYESARFDRLLDIADALGIKVHIRVEFGARATPTKRSSHMTGQRRAVTQPA